MNKPLEFYERHSETLPREPEPTAEQREDLIVAHHIRELQKRGFHITRDA